MIVFINAKVLTMENKNILENMQVEVSGDKISYIGKKRKTDGQVIDCKGKLLMPAFVNAHCHGPMIKYLGVGKDLKLEDWLSVVQKLEKDLTYDEIYNLCLAVADEYIKNGITTILELYFFSDAMLKAFNKKGIRCKVGVSAHNIHDGKREKLLENEIKKVGAKNAVSYFHSIYALDETEIAANIRLARKYDLLTTLHLSETLNEVGECFKKYQMTPVEYCEKLGVFDSKTLIAHAVHMDIGDLDILQHYNVAVVSCPASNVKLASGIPPVTAMLKKGIKVCLATDGISSNGKLDMFREMYLTSVLQKVHNSDTDAISNFEILKMATVNGAEILGYDNLGKIKKDFLADLILVDITKQKFFGTTNIVPAIIYSAGADDICLCMSNGKILYKEGI